MLPLDLIGAMKTTHALSAVASPIAGAAAFAVRRKLLELVVDQMRDETVKRYAKAILEEKFRVDPTAAPQPISPDDSFGAVVDTAVGRNAYEEARGQNIGRQ